MTELLLTSEQLGQLVAQFFIAGAGTLSFAVLFASPKRTLPYCGLVGAMGWFIYELAVLFGLESFTASLLAVIPLTLVAVAALYLTQEILDGLFSSDNVSHLTHIVGGLCGAAMGLFLRR